MRTIGQRCEEHGCELSACGAMTEDGPSDDCRECLLEARIAELERDLAALNRRLQVRFAHEQELERENAELAQKVSDVEYWSADNAAVFDDASIAAIEVSAAEDLDAASIFWRYLNQERAARKAE